MAVWTDSAGYAWGSQQQYLDYLASRNTTSTTPPPASGGGDLQGDASLLAQFEVMFPWMRELGLDAKWLQNLVATSASTDEMIVKVRQEPAYRKRFPGLWREDGSLRMNEAEYLRTEQTYRQLLRQYGMPEESYRTPADLKGFFDGEVDPNELNQRLDTYVKVRDGSQAVRDAFYVYAGLDLSVDDLYEAVVDQEARSNLVREYQVRVSSGFDYQTFLDRVTTLAGRRAADLVSMKDNTLTIDRVPRDPNLVRSVLDVLYTSGEGRPDGNPLSLQELLASYEEALLGAAASEAGLGLPSKDRIAQIRAAGVERARAQQAYLQFGLQRGALSGADQRMGGTGVDRTTMENAAFFGQGDAARQLELAQAAERAAGESGGSFRFDQRGDRLFQRGLT